MWRSQIRLYKLLTRQYCDVKNYRWNNPSLHLIELFCVSPEPCTRRKKRCPYSKQQIRELEREFLFNIYINKDRRMQLSHLLRLTDRCVNNPLNQDSFFTSPLFYRSGWGIHGEVRFKQKNFNHRKSILNTALMLKATRSYYQAHAHAVCITHLNRKSQESAMWKRRKSPSIRIPGSEIVLTCYISSCHSVKLSWSVKWTAHKCV